MGDYIISDPITQQSLYLFAQIIKNKQNLKIIYFQLFLVWIWLENAYGKLERVQKTFLSRLNFAQTKKEKNTEQVNKVNWTKVNKNIWTKVDRAHRVKLG